MSKPERSETAAPAVGFPVDCPVGRPAPERKERPILFSAPMVRALLAGTKTQTRRVAKIDDVAYGLPVRWVSVGPATTGLQNVRCPYGGPGDRLWVRETWARDDEDGALMYRADLGRDMNADAWEQGRLEGVPRYRWKPSIHMPRQASRLMLEVTGVRVERLHQISRGDAMAEGCPFANMQDGESPVRWYEYLWRSINGPDSWDANPWVWAVEFRKTPNVGIQPRLHGDD